MTIYRLDPTHMRLRIALLAVVFLGLFAGVIISILVVNNVLHLPFPVNIVAIPAIAAGIALGLTWAAEKYLAPRWPSGRALHVTQAGITLQERTGPGASIAWGQRINVQVWHFVVRKRRAWVPKGWVCVACQLKQDESVIVPYAFFKPELALTLPQWEAFEELLPRKATEKSGKDHPLSDIGAQAQLRYAEQDRWRAGVEMTPTDFIQLVTEIRQHVPDWQP